MAVTQSVGSGLCGDFRDNLRLEVGKKGRGGETGAMTLYSGAAVVLHSVVSCPRFSVGAPSHIEEPTPLFCAVCTNKALGVVTRENETKR